MYGLPGMDKCLSLPQRLRKISPSVSHKQAELGQGRPGKGGHNPDRRARLVLGFLPHRGIISRISQMSFRIIMICAAIAAAMLFAPAFAASQKDHEDCSKAGGDIAIPSCTRIIDDRYESTRNRAIAHYN